MVGSIFDLPFGHNPGMGVILLPSRSWDILWLGKCATSPSVISVSILSCYNVCVCSCVHLCRCHLLWRFSSVVIRTYHVKRPTIITTTQPPHWSWQSSIGQPSMSFSMVRTTACQTNWRPDAAFPRRDDAVLSVYLGSYARCRRYLPYFDDRPLCRPIDGWL